MLAKFNYKPEEDVGRLKQALGLKDEEDDVKYIDDSLGFQSVCCRIRGRRWGSGAFVKMLPPWKMSQVFDSVKKQAIDMAVKQGQTNGLNEEQVQELVDKMTSDLGNMSFQEQSVQMARSRILNDGTYQLPQDSLLVIPKLFDNIVVVDKEKEEKDPTMLVFEDLTAIGFQPQEFIKPVSEEDSIEIASALADFHGMLWYYKDRLGFETQKKAFLQGKHDDAIREQYRDMIKSVVDTLGQDSQDMMSSVIEDICDGYVDRSVKPIMMVHGDPWVQNILLRRDPETNKVNGVVFLDLGAIHAGTPMQDLCCFFLTSTERFNGNVWKQMKQVYKERLQFQCGNMQGEIDDLYSAYATRHGFASSLVYYTESDVGGMEVLTRKRQLNALSVARKAVIQFRENDDTLQMNQNSELRKRK